MSKFFIHYKQYVYCQDDDILRDELMKEFNTLSIVYGTTSDNFIAEENQLTFVKMPAEHPLDRSRLLPIQLL